MHMAVLEEQAEPSLSCKPRARDVTSMNLGSLLLKRLSNNCLIVVKHEVSFVAHVNGSSFVFLRFLFLGFYLFIYWLCWVFLAAGVFSSVEIRGYCLVVIRGLFNVVGAQALLHRLGSRGTWAWLLYCMWDLPRPGIESVAPALAGYAQ